MKDDTIIGIVGGMGPQAGSALFDRIIRHTYATTDQEHLSVVLMSFPKYIGDRTAYINRQSSTNPAFNIVRIVRKLESAGAEVVGMACNTCHSPEIFGVIVNELKKVNSQVRLLNMPLEVCVFLHKNYGHIQRVGLLSTNGTYQSKLYNGILESFGFSIVLPDMTFQNDLIHRMIYDPVFGIKANPGGITREVRLLASRAFDFFRKNAEAVVIGCTELSLLQDEGLTGDMVTIDAMDALALALIREARATQQNDHSLVGAT